MLNITRLLCGKATTGDELRYGERASHPQAIRSPAVHHRPVVVWNLTRRCNLHCAHCYMDAFDREFPGELTTSEAVAVIDDLAQFGVPVLLLSGGEPLMRPDILELCSYAFSQGLRAVLSSNGTLIQPELAAAIKNAGVSYAGISIDGAEATHDRFRGMKGAFQQTLEGIRNLQRAGVKTGLRCTITRFNLRELDYIFDLAERENLQRLCFYHLAYGGRGERIRKHDLSPEESRQAVDTIFNRTLELDSRGIDMEVLTVDNHADAAYLYLKVKETQPNRADEVYKLLRRNGGNTAGSGIVCIDPQGNLHPDQFWQSYTIGNVRQSPFSALLSNGADPMLAALRDRRPLLKGRCAGCRYLDICNGNLRVRAQAVYGDPWAEDPACYLTEEEI